nr:ribonuclease H-like domain, reverse transcriptase, RNA-dependent DNA polymerase [Tanacetum cinerariifolium]
NPQMDLQDQGVIDNGCSRHMIGNMSYLTDYEEIDRGYVTFGGNPKGGKITGKYTIKTDFMVYQMDLKSAFLYGKIEEEVYVCQLPGFEDLDFPDRVYKVEKALYGLHQAPKAWFTEVKTANTTMETQKPILKDEDGEEVDVHMYRYQVNPKVSHLHVAKRIFRESLDRKSKTEDYQFLRCRLISWQCKKQTVVVNFITEAEYVAASNGKELVITDSSVGRDLQLADEEGIDCLPNSTIFEQLALMGKPKRKDTHVPQSSGPTKSVIDKVVHKELGDRLVRAATTASSLGAEQDSGDTTAQTRFKSVSKRPNDSLFARSNTLRSDKDSIKLDELMALCTTLQNRVLDLEKTTTTQRNEIDSLKRRVKKLEKRNGSRTHKLKRLYKVGLSARVESSGDEESLGEDASKQGRRIDAIDANENITLVNDTDNEMFDVDDLGGEEVFVVGQNENVVEEVVDAAQVSTAATTVTITTEDITLAQALEALKTSKPKVKWIVFQEPGKSTTTTIISSQQSHNKDKGIMIEEPVKPKKKDQIRLDEEAAKKLQVEFNEEERLTREKAEKEKRANIALIETQDDIQAKIDVDHQLAKILQAQAQEQEELSDAEKDTLFQQLLEKRRSTLQLKEYKRK